MARAGYDPRAALDLWEILTDLEAEIREQGGDNGSIADRLPFLRTHPSSGQRIKVSLPGPLPSLQPPLFSILNTNHLASLFRTSRSTCRQR